MSVEAFLESLHLFTQWETYFYIILGISLGVIIGAVPGIGGTIGMAILVPFTFFLDGMMAMLMLIGIYSGTGYAGSVPAILIRTPGSGSGAAAVFEGYPLSRQGKAKQAIAAAATASAVGGTVSLLVLILSVDRLFPLLMYFGSAELFLIVLLALGLIPLVGRGSLLQGLLAGFFGLMITTVGYTTGGTTRYTFGSLQLYDGIDFIAVILGVFAVSEMFKLSMEKGSIAKGEGQPLEGSVFEGVWETLTRPVTLVKSAFIGMGIGAIPGAGATIATFISYIECIRSDDDPGSYGKGNYRGVVAVDAASNGTISGALIPTLSFGIPGGGMTAVFIGAMMMHGFAPGPALLGSEITFTYSLLTGILLGNVVILLMGVFFVSSTAIITKVNTNYLIPVILILCFAGAFVLSVNWLDPLTVFVAGIIGYFMSRYDYSVVAFIMGVILGPIAEKNMLRALQANGYDPSIFVESTLSKIIILMMVALLVLPMVRRYVSGRRSSA